MDHHMSEESDLLSDLENGGTTSQQDSGNWSVMGKKTANKPLDRLAGGTLHSGGTTGCEGNLHSYSNFGNSSEVPHNDIESLMEKNAEGGQSEEHIPLVEKKCVQEKGNATKLKNASKPPRPPKGPSLDAADLKFIKEISDHAMKKREKIERLKQLKRSRAFKSSSSSSSSSLSSKIILFAVVFTLFFFLMLTFQGILSRNSSREGLDGSPEPAVATDSLIAVEYYGNLLERDGISPSSKSPNLPEHDSG